MMQKIIRLFKSIKLAAILILVLALLSLAGILLPQLPADIAALDGGYTWWLENVAGGSGLYTRLLGTLGFYDIFHSFWFLAAAALLMLNILVCSVARYRAIASAAAKTGIMKDRDHYQNGKQHASLVSANTSTDIAGQAARILRRHHYQVTLAKDGDAIYIAGDKNRLSGLGTLAIHLSLLVFMLGILAGGIWGIRNDSFVIAENSTRDIGFNTGLSLVLKSFTDTYWDDGTPKDYRSEVAILENGQEVKSAIIQVNHPLIYRGIRIHQSFFGPAIQLQIADAAHDLAVNDSVPLTNSRSSGSVTRPEGRVKLPGSGYTVVVVAPSGDGLDTSIGQNEIGLELYDDNQALIGWLKLAKGAPQTINDMVFSYTGQNQYSGFQISRDPGNALIWIASILFLLGLTVIFYLPRHQIWLALNPRPHQGTDVSIRLHSAREAGPADELARIQKELLASGKKEGE
jgi:cytochrome c biogenesis protein